MRPRHLFPARARPSAPLHRLGSLDGVFLAVENDHNPMAIGSVGLFEGPPPSLEQLLSFLSSRLSLEPRCRQRLRHAVGSLARPVWIDDVHFELSQHVHELSLPTGQSKNFDDLVADVLASPLDRRRPLWNVSLVTGLEDGRWAIITKIHHCMVDGIAGSDLLGVFLTAEPSVAVNNSISWTLQPEPTSMAILWFMIYSASRTWMTRLLRAPILIAHPLRTMQHIRQVVSAAKRLWYRQPHQPTSLVGRIGTKRSWRHLDVSLADVHSIQQSFGGTINDVVITAVTNGFHELLLARGETTMKRSITAMVPVSLRRPTERGSLGNRVANVHAQLPIDEDDPRHLLERVSDQLNELKESHEVDATGLLMHIGEYVPRFLADRITRGVFLRQRIVETVITNVPGPHSSLFLGPHRMIAAYPVAPIGGLVRTTVAVWSYDDRLAIGVSADRDSNPDIDILSEGIRRGFDNLLELVERQRSRFPV